MNCISVSFRYENIIYAYLSNPSERVFIILIIFAYELLCKRDLVK